MNRKIWKALGIAVCMLALAAPRAMAARYEVGEDAPFIKFGDAVDKINKSGDAENGKCRFPTLPCMRNGSFTPLTSIFKTKKLNRVIKWQEKR